MLADMDILKGKKMFNFTSKGSKDNQIKLQQDKVAEMEASGKKPMFIGGEQFFKSLRDLDTATKAKPFVIS